MFGREWVYELRGAARFLLGALLSGVAGTVFTVVGLLVPGDEFFLFAFLSLGVLFFFLAVVLVAASVYGFFLRRRQPENYEAWLWWMNLTGGLVGALLFAIPSTLALPVMLLAGGEDRSILIGAVFSAVGLVATVLVGLLARRQLRGRPRWIRD